MRKTFKMILALALVMMGATNAMGQKTYSGIKSSLRGVELEGTMKPVTGILSMIRNGDAEGDDLSSFRVSWDGPNNGSTANDLPEIVAGVGVNGSRCFKVVSYPEPTETWHTQFYIKSDEVLPKGTKWALKMSIKAERNTKITTSAQAAPRSWMGSMGINEFAVTTDWQEYTWTGEIGVDGFQSIAFDLNNGDERCIDDSGWLPGNGTCGFFFDNIEFGIVGDLKDGSDMTRFIKNPGFDADKDINSGKAEGWTIDAGTGGNLTRGPLGQGNMDLMESSLGYMNYCFEAWHRYNWDVWQEIEDLPKGMYELSVQGYVRCEVGGYNRGDDINPDYPSPIYLYMNNAKVQFPSVYSESPIDYGHNMVEVESWYQEVINDKPYPNSMGGAAQCFGWDIYKIKTFGLIAKEGDKFRIGVKMEGNQDWWCIWDNFKLTYRKPTVEIVKPILEEELTKFDLLQDMSSEVLDKLAKVKQDALAAIASNDCERMFDALVSVMELDLGYEGLTVGDIKDGSDMTRFIKNPGFDADKDINSGKAEGWTIDAGTGGNLTRGPLGQGNMELMESSLGYMNWCFEAWHRYNWDVWQEVENLPRGMYELNVQGYVRCEVGGYNRGDDINPDYPSPIYLYMNNAKAQFPSVYSELPADYGHEMVTVEDWYQETINDKPYPNSMGSATQCFAWGMYKVKTFGLIVKKGDKFRIGVKMEGNQDWWCIWDSFKLTYRKPTVDIVKPILEEELTKFDLLQGMSSEVLEKLARVKQDALAAIASNDGEQMFDALVAVMEIDLESETLTANNISIFAGQTATANICLNNGMRTDYTAYQFDLVLPAGIDIAKNAKGKPDVTKGSRYEDDSHTLTVQKVEGTTGTYRVVCFSLENSLIEGTEGALLAVKLQAAAGLNEGEYTAKLENILLTQKDGTQRKMNDAMLKIVVSRVVQGDANGDNEVNVADIVEVVNCILGNPSPSFVFAAADLNGDGEVNVTDIVMMVNIIMSGGNARGKEPVAMTRGDGDKLTLNNEGNDAFGLNLHNEAQYVAAQMDIVLTEGQTLADVTLNRDRCESHQLSFQQKGENTYRVLVFSLTNDGFEGSDGNLLSFRIAGGAGSFSVENIVLVQADASQHPFAPLYGETTGIGATLNDNGQMINDKWYDLNGRKLDGQPTRKGVYIRNGKKQTVR